MRPGLEYPAQLVAQAIQDVADGLAGRHLPGQFGNGQQRVTDRLGREPGVGERGLELGIGLSVWIDQPPDVLLHFGVQVLGGRAPARLERFQAPNPGAEFVQPGMDRVPTPTERGLGQTSGSAAVRVRHLGLEPAPLVPGE